LSTAFQIGPIRVAWYGILIAIGVLAAVFVASREVKRRGESFDDLVNMLILILPLGIIGARLYHVIDKWSEIYSKDPSLIIGGMGLGIFGAVIGGIIGLVIYTQWKKLSTLRWLDICAPGVILAQAIGRWGNFFNQELYGYPTNLPWGIYISPENRIAGYEAYEHFQPLFLYESLLDFIGFLLLIIIGRKYAKKLLDGEIFVLYIIYYGIVRFTLEFFKIDVWKIGGFPTAQWIVIIAIVVAITYCVIRRLYNKRKKLNIPTIGQSNIT
jgi:phosphatidylglycerol---prolipoprotein diacylglyceryl transferase